MQWLPRQMRWRGRGPWARGISSVEGEKERMKVKGGRGATRGIAVAVVVTVAVAVAVAVVLLIVNKTTRRQRAAAVGDVGTIAGMTSVPPRFASEDFDRALASLLGQKRADGGPAVDLVVVTLPADKDYDGAKIARLQTMERVAVRRPPVDHGPIMKLLGMLGHLQDHPEQKPSTLLLADDDVNYEQSAAATLLGAMRAEQFRAVGFAARRHENLQFVMAPEAAEPAEGEAKGYPKASSLAFLETFALVAYESELFSPPADAAARLLELQDAVPEARFTDDITIGKYVAERGVQVRLASVRGDYSPVAAYLNDHGVALRDSNLGGRNMRVYLAMRRAGSPARSARPHTAASASPAQP